MSLHKKRQMETRWTHSNIVERARIDAVSDHIFGGSDHYNDTISQFKKTEDIRDYKYNYQIAYDKETSPSKRGYRKGRSSRG